MLCSNLGGHWKLHFSRFSLLFLFSLVFLCRCTDGVCFFVDVKVLFVPLLE